MYTPLIAEKFIFGISFGTARSMAFLSHPTPLASLQYRPLGMPTLFCKRERAKRVLEYLVNKVWGVKEDVPVIIG